MLSGKILKDEETVGSYNIEEKGFVVCMVNKVRIYNSLLGPRPLLKPLAIAQGKACASSTRRRVLCRTPSDARSTRCQHAGRSSRSCSGFFASVCRSCDSNPPALR